LCSYILKKNFNLIKIVTSIPTHKLPKNLTVGSDVPDIATYPAIDGSAADSELRKGQVLWLRGIARLQTQLRVVNAFHETMSDYPPDIRKAFLATHDSPNLDRKFSNI
jgi:hypothetical protein